MPIVNLGKLENKAMKHCNGLSSVTLMLPQSTMAYLRPPKERKKKKKNMLHALLTIMEIYYLALTLNLLEQFGTVQHDFCRKSATISATDANSLAD